MRIRIIYLLLSKQILFRVLNSKSVPTFANNGVYYLGNIVNDANIFLIIGQIHFLISLSSMTLQFFMTFYCLPCRHQSWASISHWSLPGLLWWASYFSRCHPIVRLLTGLFQKTLFIQRFSPLRITWPVDIHLLVLVCLISFSFKKRVTYFFLIYAYNHYI